MYGPFNTPSTLLSRADVPKYNRVINCRHPWPRQNQFDYFIAGRIRRQDQDVAGPGPPIAPGVYRDAPRNRVSVSVPDSPQSAQMQAGHEPHQLNGCSFRRCARSVATPARVFKRHPPRPRPLRLTAPYRLVASAAVLLRRTVGVLHIIGWSTTLSKAAGLFCLIAPFPPLL